jgi:hypothetical protein
MTCATASADDFGDVTNRMLISMFVDVIHDIATGDLSAEARRWSRQLDGELMRRLASVDGDDHA